ncbi:pyridoxamine 5'-phosphate oxidase family protein [Roseibium aestuarii]|uniref:Pyridoxamine 5'-phosphate oxidase family protein n=1 Tax=Roseibium aestuarii TaxID=2600299 RepID=A0ABW4JYZ2_9HYPH|nr:pyridoxamine 5'-phosphate oxidase family protein [Roseibium aestuarii]
MTRKEHGAASVPSSDVAFTETVKAIQSAKGSREIYAHMEEGGAWETRITPFLERFLANRTSAYLATANAQGQPYIQHRGGPAGFLHVLDEQTIAFADFAGNRQYITLGNLAENPRAHLFLMDYAFRERVKIWGEARVVEDDPALLQRLAPTGYRARPERVILFTIKAWDANCPQHIPRLLSPAQVNEELARQKARIAELEAELADLRK